MAAEETKPKSRLFDNLEKLEQLTLTLRQASEDYAALKQFFGQFRQTGEIPEGASLRLTLPGMTSDLPLGRVESTDAMTAHLDEALGVLGNQVADLWNEIHQVTANSVSHCNDARKRAEEQAQQPA